MPQSMWFAIAPLSSYGIVAALAIPFAIYVIARWRGYREGNDDPQLGLKIALCFFGFLAFELSLTGSTLLLWALFSKMSSGEKGDLLRVAMGMLAPGVIVLGAHLALLRKTNQAQFPSVRRMFLGYTVFVTGVVGFVGLVLAFQALFMKGSSGELGPIAGAMVVVFGSAWAIVGWQFGKNVLEAPPAPPPAATSTSAPAQPGLPALGGGAFPPLEKKT